MQAPEARSRFRERLGLLGNLGFQLEVGLPRFYVRYPLWQLKKRLSRGTPTFTLATGLPMSLPSDHVASSTIYVSDCNCDWGGDRMLVSMLETGRDFVDVGAHIGYYSLLAAPRVRRVYAFEPDPRNLDALEENAARAGNIEVVRAAVGSSGGAALLDVRRDPSVSRLVAAAGAGVIDVSATTLDSFAGQTPGFDPAAIKIDVEGGELAVLTGATDVVARSQPLVFMEFGVDAENVERLHSLIGAWTGYSVFGYLRSAHAKSGWRAKLREVRPETAGGYGSKMVFLVPPRLREAFLARAAS